MGLEQIRKGIDVIDSRILKLLNDRMEKVLMVRKFKQQIEDKEREKDLMNRIGESSSRLVSVEFLKKIYAEIFQESKALQEQNYEIIAFQGEHGAYGEVAAREWNRDLVPIPCNEFAQVFEGVASGTYDYGIVPVENTLGGVVGDVNELLINTDLNVVGAVELPIRLCLLVLPGADHREIRNVYSHPQALAQCRRFLSRNKLDPVQFYDTAGAAKMLADKRPKGSAAIASKLCSRLYGLEVIKEGIEDLEGNTTRFLLLAKEEDEAEGEKCSVTFTTEHKAGTLFRVLEVFARAHINLTRIESIPDEPGKYAFLLDFAGSNRDEKVKKALQEVKTITSRFKLLGSYREKRAL